MHNGVVRKYYPDFIVQLGPGDFLVLETKGQQTEEDDSKHVYMKDSKHVYMKDSKHVYMKDWVKAVNERRGFGKWRFAVSRKPADIKDILAG